MSFDKIFDLKAGVYFCFYNMGIISFIGLPFHFSLSVFASEGMYIMNLLKWSGASEGKSTHTSTVLLVACVT